MLTLLSAEERALDIFYEYDIARWIQEFADYTSASEDLETYSEQDVEVKANKYAYEATKEIFHQIDEMMKMDTCKPICN